jgi:outer membrane protein OmpA-like peptidoglycan-associated protein
MTPAMQLTPTSGWLRCAIGRALLAAVLLAALTLPTARTAPAEDAKPAPGTKSAEDILNSLLGGDEGSRGIGGVRTEKGRDTGGRIALPVQFEYNSATITQSSIPQLQHVAEALKDERLRSARILVEGHTDSSGSPGYNQGLSERRAEAVKKYLSEQLGIDASRLVAKGAGQSKPLPGVSEDTEEGRAQNRRVELINLNLAKASSGSKPVAESKLTVKVVVSYQQGGAQHVLKPGSVLTPDDNYRVTFTPNRDSYVYVFQLDTKGKVEPIFPNSRLSETANPVKSKSTQVVPPEGQWLSLDRDPGEEQIVVLASESPLPDPRALAMRMAKGEAELTTAMRGPAANPRGDVLAEPPPGMFSYRLPFTHQ